MHRYAVRSGGVSEDRNPLRQPETKRLTQPGKRDRTTAEVGLRKIMEPTAVRREPNSHGSRRTAPVLVDHHVNEVVVTAAELKDDVSGRHPDTVRLKWISDRWMPVEATSAWHRHYDEASSPQERPEPVGADTAATRGLGDDHPGPFACPHEPGVDELVRIAPLNIEPGSRERRLAHCMAVGCGVPRKPMPVRAFRLLTSADEVHRQTVDYGKVVCQLAEQLRRADPCDHPDTTGLEPDDLVEGRRPRRPGRAWLTRSCRRSEELSDVRHTRIMRPTADSLADTEVWLGAWDRLRLPRSLEPGQHVEHTQRADLPAQPCILAQALKPVVEAAV